MVYLKFFVIGILLFLSASQLFAQQVIFSENFENKVLDSSWQPVNGNWHIADVSELKIAPAEHGFRYVLCADSSGYIRCFLDIPGSIKASQVKFSFSYYTYAQGSGGTVEFEFHKKNWKDGIRGKVLKASLPVKGKWTDYQKTLKIPPEANS